MTREERLEKALRGLLDTAMWIGGASTKQFEAIAAAKEALAPEVASPTMTDLMVTPESIGPFIDANPPPTPEESEKCPECDGTGEWWAFFAKERCHRCGGSGLKSQEK